MAKKTTFKKSKLLNFVEDVFRPKQYIQCYNS